MFLHYIYLIIMNYANLCKNIERYLNRIYIYIQMGGEKGDKKTTSELLKLIIKSVSEGEKSILEIAKDVESNWETVKTYLEALTTAGIFAEEDRGNKRVFIIQNNRNNQTYFNLPLTKDQESLAKGLLYKINEKWNTLKNTPITQLQAQKILWKLVNRHNLDIPIGKYIFGGVSVCAHCDFSEFTTIKIGQDIIDNLNTITEEVSKDKYAYITKQNHYIELANETYNNKEVILGLLYSQNFSKYSISHIIKLFTKMLSQEDKIIQDNEAKEILQAYSDLLFDINSCYSPELLNENKITFIKLFEKVWKLISMFIFKNDLEKYYTKTTLDVNFSYEIEITKKEILEMARELQSQVIEEEPNDETYLELKELQKKYSSEAKKDLSKTKRKDLFNEIDL